MPTYDLDRLAEAVHRRREELGLGQGDLIARGGPGVTTVGKIERSQIEKPQNATLKRLDDALAWEPGSARRVLAGGDPAVRNATGSVGPRTQDSSYVEDRRAGDPEPGISDEEVVALIERQQRELAELLEKMRARPSRPVDGAP